MRLTLLLPLVVLAACAPKQNVTSMGKFGGAPPSMIVSSDVRTAGGETLGVATFAQEPDGLWVSLETSGLPAGEYGVHLHAIGSCEGPDFTSAGPHYNPAGTQHGSADILPLPLSPTTRLGRSPACGPAGLALPCCVPAGL